MIQLQPGDYVRHADLTLDQYLTFANQAIAAGFRIDYDDSEHRYELWGYTVLYKNQQQCGKDGEPTSPNHRDVTHHFNNFSRLQPGDYVCHADLTFDQYLMFTHQAQAAGFDTGCCSPKVRYGIWRYTTLVDVKTQIGTDTELSKTNRRNVTRHFTNAPVLDDPNVNGPFRDELLAQGWVPPTATPKEQWVEMAGDIANPEHETAKDFLEAIYDAMKSGRLSTP